MKKKNNEKSEELLKKMADSSEHIDWGESINEPYEFNMESPEFEGAELMTGISSDQPLKQIEPKYAIKGYFAVPGSNWNTARMEIHFEHESYDNSFSEIREDYVELIKEMRRAKHRNELVCKDIETKHDKYITSKKHH
jgi:hypothetical protein